jgi:predicted outer membrane lipoprotein
MTFFRTFLAILGVLLACVIILALAGLEAVAKKVKPAYQPPSCQPWRETCPTRFET